MQNYDFVANVVIYNFRKQTSFYGLQQRSEVPCCGNRVERAGHRAVGNWRHAGALCCGECCKCVHCYGDANLPDAIGEQKQFAPPRENRATGAVEECPEWKLGGQLNRKNRKMNRGKLQCGSNSSFVV